MHLKRKRQGAQHHLGDEKRDNRRVGKEVGADKNHPKAGPEHHPVDGLDLDDLCESLGERELEIHAVIKVVRHLQLSGLLLVVDEPVPEPVVLCPLLRLRLGPLGHEGARLEASLRQRHELQDFVLGRDELAADGILRVVDGACDSCGPTTFWCLEQRLSLSSFLCLVCGGAARAQIRDRELPRLPLLGGPEREVEVHEHRKDEEDRHEEEQEVEALEDLLQLVGLSEEVFRQLLHDGARTLAVGIEVVRQQEGKRSDEAQGGQLRKKSLDDGLEDIGCAVLDRLLADVEDYRQEDEH
mmetsp:Transcript_8211/g.20387  ORF Transcript_8211/g.20387 Transcript_8211/m.20387 type:complete len:298 (+) Transcript_8211:1223-2116(+)